MPTVRTKEAAAYKVRPNALLSADDATMFASFNASVPEVDREEEVIEPGAFRTEHWQANPVWLWAHDKAQLPIGAGYKPDGTVACLQTKDALILGCRFSQANPQGPLTYALYKEGTLKMVSVGFITTAANKVMGTPWGVNYPVTHITDAELVECSCVPIGMNRGAMLLSIKSWDGYVDRVGLASVLDKGHLHGEKVPESMRRDLAEFAATPRFKLAAWNVKALSLNKIPKFSSEPGGKLLALHQPFGSSFMASIAKAPLKAGAIPAKPESVVETKAVKVDDEKPKEDETKTKADESSTPADKPMLSIGAQIYKAMMESMAGMCQGAMEMMPQSDSPDVQKYVTRMCGKAAAYVGELYDEAAKAFPDFVADFEEPATLAAVYAAIEEEPDTADAGPGQDQDLLEDVTKEEGGETPDDETADADAEDAEDEDGAESKGVDDVVLTVADFNDWHNKTFGEMNAKEAIEALVQPLTAKIAELEAKLGEHHEALEGVNTYFAGVR